ALGRGRGVAVVEDVSEREAVLRAEREDDVLLVGRGLQLEAEADAERLPKRESPVLVDARPARGVDDELHAAALVEEPLEDDAPLRRDGTENGAPLRDELGDLPRGPVG